MRTSCFLMCMATFCLLAAAVFQTAGCGYRLAGSGQMPGQVRSVCIHVFENRTAQSDAGSLFSSSLIYEFTRRGSVALVSEAEAEAQLKGIVTAITTSTLSHRDAYASSEMRVQMRVEARLEGPGGRVLWTSGPMTGKETYDVSGGAAYATEENKKAAITRLSEKMAESMYNRMTADF
ncbi:MAG: LPS assembly lipoprotein LptE [Thermodesulfobacteriota bacterium]